MILDECDDLRSDFWGTTPHFCILAVDAQTVFDFSCSHILAWNPSELLGHAVHSNQLYSHIQSKINSRSASSSHLVQRQCPDRCACNSHRLLTASVQVQQTLI